MDINELKERLIFLNAQFQEAQNRASQATSDMTAIDGAIQEVNFWINKVQELSEKN